MTLQKIVFLLGLTSTAGHGGLLFIFLNHYYWETLALEGQMRQHQDGHNDDARGGRRTRVHAVQQLQVDKWEEVETEQKHHPRYPEWDDVETEQRFDKHWNIGMTNCRECGLEGLVIGLHGLRISDRFSDRDKVLCGACIEEKKTNKKTILYKSSWTAGMVR